jgi:hypothetical protein
MLLREHAVDNRDAMMVAMVAIALFVAVVVCCTFT